MKRRVVRRPGPLAQRHCEGCRCFLPLSNPDENTVGAHHGRRSGAPDTEREAAYAVMPRTGTKRRAALDAYAERWFAAEDGLSDYELRHELGAHNGGPQARRHELMKGNWLEDSGRRRQTGHGGSATVWVLSPSGRRRYDAAR